MTIRNTIKDRLFCFFESRIDPFPQAESKAPPSGLWAFFRYYARGLEPYLFGLAFFSFASAAIEVTLFGVLGSIIDWMTQTPKAQFFTTYWPQLTLLAVALLVIMPLVVLLHALVLQVAILGNFPMRIRWLGHRYLLRQSIGFYSNEFAGRVATKLMQTALALRDSIVKCFDVLVYIAVYFFSILILLGSTDWRLAMPVLIWLIMYCGILHYFLPRMKSISTAQADARSEMTGRIVDAYSNIMTVKLFTHADRETNYAKAAMAPFLGTVHQQMRLATGLQWAVQGSVYLMVFFEFAVSISLWYFGLVSEGMVATAIMVTLRINGLAQWVMWEANLFFENLGTVVDGKNTLSTPITLLDSPQAQPLRVSKGHIRFDQISFHYGKTQGGIHHLDLKIRPGEKIGLIGRSGAGKSTLVNLLLRFYDVESGQILIDDQIITSVTQESLRSQIGVVTQDTSLLHRTIRENVAYGRPNATDQDIEGALRQSKAWEFVQNLTDQYGACGLDALVGERGIKLSGGQRQRIAIARVLLKNAPILILDEATSALDSEVEQIIQSSLEDLMDSKTVIAIAHRLSTIAALDRLIVIDEGQIIEQGTHQQLLQQNGLYSSLWSHQTGGFIAEN